MTWKMAERAADLIELDENGRETNLNQVCDKLIAEFKTADHTAFDAAKRGATIARKRQGISIRGKRADEPYVALPLKVPPDVAEWFDEHPNLNRNGFIVEAIRRAIDLT